MARPRHAGARLPPPSAPKEGLPPPSLRRAGAGKDKDPTTRVLFRGQNAANKPPHLPPAGMRSFRVSLWARAAGVRPPDRPRHAAKNTSKTGIVTVLVNRHGPV